MNAVIKSSDINNVEGKSDGSKFKEKEIIEIKATKKTQKHIIIDDCKVKLNFPTESADSVLKDIERMMVGALIVE